MVRVEEERTKGPQQKYYRGVWWARTLGRGALGTKNTGLWTFSMWRKSPQVFCNKLITVSKTVASSV